MSKVSILNGIDTVVVSQGVYYPLKIETRDKYENLCELEYTEEMFEINIKQVLKSYNGMAECDKYCTVVAEGVYAIVAVWYSGTSFSIYVPRRYSVFWLSAYFILAGNM